MSVLLVSITSPEWSVVASSPSETVKVASSSTLPVSSLAVGAAEASMVIVIVAVCVSSPSETV